MKALIAMDSFKGSLSSIEAGNAVREGVLRADPRAEVTQCPLADGGEGTVNALCGAEKGQIVEVTVTGPLGEPVRAKYGILQNQIAVMEIAAAAGLPLIPDEKRNPLYTTTYGVGEMIRDAMDRGCREFLIGLGGSGTNDGGAGMLSALGWRFTDRRGYLIPPGAVGLQKLWAVEGSGVSPELCGCRFRIACDVTNPLLGENGCSAVFGPQKGADPEAVKNMDAWLKGYSTVVKQYFPAADPDFPGAGAAGGLGFAFSAFLQGGLEPGGRIVSELWELEEKISHCDIVITGEGRLDRQTGMGKGPSYIAGLGKKYGKPVVAIVGSVSKGSEALMEEGFRAYFPILPRPMSLQEAMESKTAYENIRNTAFHIFSLLSI